MNKEEISYLWGALRKENKLLDALSYKTLWALYTRKGYEDLGTRVVRLLPPPCTGMQLILYDDNSIAKITKILSSGALIMSTTMPCTTRPPVIIRYYGANHDFYRLFLSFITVPRFVDEIDDERKTIAAVYKWVVKGDFDGAYRVLNDRIGTVV